MAEHPGVAITRAAEDAEALSSSLARLGLRPVRTPLLHFVQREASVLASMLGSEARYDWLAFTSRHAVLALSAACETRGRSLSGLPVGLVGAVGERTADALRTLGMRVDVIPDVPNAEHLAQAMLARSGSAPGRVLFPRALEARETLPSTLRAAGWEVDDVPCYETCPYAPGGESLAAALQRRDVSAVTLASGSAARAFVQFVPPALWSLARLVSIGGTTSSVARTLGLTVSAESAAPTMDALAFAARRILPDLLSHA